MFSCWPPIYLNASGGNSRAILPVGKDPGCHPAYDCSVVRVLQRRTWRAFRSIETAHGAINFCYSGIEARRQANSRAAQFEFPSTRQLRAFDGVARSSTRCAPFNVAMSWSGPIVRLAHALTCPDAFIQWLPILR